MAAGLLAEETARNRVTCEVVPVGVLRGVLQRLGDGRPGAVRRGGARKRGALRHGAPADVRPPGAAAGTQGRDRLRDARGAGGSSGECRISS